MAMLLSAWRKRRGIDASASATSCSNSGPIHFLTARRRVGRRVAAGSRARRLAPGAARRSRIAPDHVLVVIAIVLHRALVAERLRLADPAAVQDQRVGGAGPSFRRQRGAQLLFDDFGIVRLGDADAVRHAQHVPIDRQPRDAERVPEHDVRRLAADAGQREQRRHVGRHLALMLLHEGLRHADERSGFRAEESGRMNLRLERRRRRARQLVRRGIPLEQRRRHQVHALVGRLRREDRRHQQLERRGVVQLGVGVGMLRLQLVENLERLVADFMPQWIPPVPLFHPTLL